MDQFISEPLEPFGDFDTAAMATGVPGLPDGFRWRDEAYTIARCLETWKQSGSERGRLHGERYLRRHYYRLLMSDGAEWTVYFVRNAPPGRRSAPRWFLYGVTDPNPGRERQ